MQTFLNSVAGLLQNLHKFGSIVAVGPACLSALPTRCLEGRRLEGRASALEYAATSGISAMPIGKVSDSAAGQRRRRVAVELTSAAARRSAMFMVVKSANDGPVWTALEWGSASTLGWSAHCFLVHDVFHHFWEVSGPEVTKGLLVQLPRCSRHPAARSGKPPGVM